MRLSFSRFRPLLAAALFFALAAPAFSQQEKLDSLAAKIAERMADKNKGILAVVDFTVAKIGRHPLGSAVSKELEASLRRIAPSLKFIERDAMAQAALRLNFLPQDVTNPMAEPVLAQAAGAEIVVTGDISGDPRKTQLTIYVTDVTVTGDGFKGELGKEIDKIRIPLQLTSEWEALRSQPAPEEENGIYRADFSNGIFPECERCSDPGYTKLARKNGTEGIVLLLITIDPQGNARDIAVMKGLKDGLTETAVEAVGHWKFKPARLRNGKPVPTRIPIEVTFRLMR